MKLLFALLPLLIGQAAALPEDQNQPFSLKLNQEIYLTDLNGAVNLIAILSVKPGDSVRVYLVSGAYFTAFVKEITQDTLGIFKVYGEMTNHPNTNFGFMLTKDGTFMGAIVQQTPNIVYQLVYNSSAKGYIFQHVGNFSLNE